MSKQSPAIGDNNKSTTIHPARIEVTRRGWKRLSQNRAHRIASISGVGVLTACVLLTVVARIHNRADAKPLVSAVLADTLNTTATTGTTTFRPSPKSNPNPAPIIGQTAVPVPGEKVEVESIILTRFGFEPKEITRSSATFLLSVVNRSQVGDVDLHLDRVAGNRIHEQQVSKEKADWRDFFKLEPGDYLLTETSHPEWVCRIKITPH
jgi:hypothetical protein